MTDLGLSVEAWKEEYGISVQWGMGKGKEWDRKRLEHQLNESFVWSSAPDGQKCMGDHGLSETTVEP